MPSLSPPSLDHPPRRVVSLVPSLTESLFDLGLGGSVVGITDYCIHPAAALARLPRVGGTKNARLDDILSLKPDLVLANQEENSRALVEGLQAEGIPVWVSFPKTVQETIEVLRTLADLFQSSSSVLKVDTLWRSVEWAEAAAGGAPSVRVFCPIWSSRLSTGEPWWMTFNHDTYAHSLLHLCGGENVFASRQRRYPLSDDLGLPISGDQETSDEVDTRYPRVSLDEIRAAAPEVILLPSEPFAFSADHLHELADLLPDAPAVQGNRVHLVDGSLITWHGTRLARAIHELPRLFV